MPRTDRIPDAVITEWMALYLPAHPDCTPADHLSPAAITGLLGAGWVNASIRRLRSEGHPIEELTEQLTHHGGGILFARWRIAHGYLSDAPEEIS